MSCTRELPTEYGPEHKCDTLSVWFRACDCFWSERTARCIQQLLGWAGNATRMADSRLPVCVANCLVWWALLEQTCGFPTSSKEVSSAQYKDVRMIALWTFFNTKILIVKVLTISARPFMCRRVCAHLCVCVHLFACRCVCVCARAVSMWDEFVVCVALTVMLLVLCGALWQVS